MSLVSPGHLVQNSLRNTMIQLMFLVVQSGHPDVQKGIKTQVRTIIMPFMSGHPDVQKGIKTDSSVRSIRLVRPDTPMFRRGLRQNH